MDPIDDLDNLVPGININGIDNIVNKLHRIAKIDNSKSIKIRGNPPPKKWERNKKLNRKKWIIPVKHG